MRSLWVLALLLNCGLHQVAFAAEAVQPSTDKCGKIVFLKTPKAGSSTLGSILWRRAIKYGKRLYSPGDVIRIKREVKPHLRGKYDYVLDHHFPQCAPTDWNSLLRVYKLVLGSSDLTVVVSIREPLARWLSVFYFFWLRDEIAAGRTPTMSRWLSSNETATNMACMFGARTSEEMVAIATTPWFKRILFVPTEYFDEALVLLADECGWDLQDMVYMKTNENDGAFHGVRAMKIAQLRTKAPRIFERLRNASAPDIALYDAASQQVLSSVAEHAHRVLAGVQYLRAVKGLMTSECSRGHAPMSMCVWYACSYGAMINTATGLLDHSMRHVFAPGCITNEQWLGYVNPKRIGDVVAEATAAAEQLMAPIPLP